MTLIKCPSCQHTVSSVASTCPQCGYLLTQPRFQQGHEGSLTECRKCGHKVLSKVRVCPYCGLSAPGRRPRVAALIAIGVIASIVAVLAMQERIVPGQLFLARPADTPGASPEQSVPNPPAGSVAAAAVPPNTVAVAPAAEGLGAADSSADSVASVPTQTRWAADWANIREARSLDALVVRVVRPGEPLQVAKRVGGWWEVYRDGRFVGYVAGDLLLAAPPP